MLKDNTAVATIGVKKIDGWPRLKIIYKQTQAFGFQPIIGACPCKEFPLGLGKPAVQGCGKL